MNIHTVISDQNIDQIYDILAISERYGWTHTLAPVNNFFYQNSSNNNVPKLHYSEKLQKIIDIANSKKNIAVSREFLLSIPLFTKGALYKLCPYLTGILKTFKIFLDPDGNLSLCSRVPIGNIKDISIRDMLKGRRYQIEMNKYRNCPGCWMACFVEILLATPKFYQRSVMNKF